MTELAHTRACARAQSCAHTCLGLRSHVPEMTSSLWLSLAAVTSVPAQNALYPVNSIITSARRTTHHLGPLLSTFSVPYRVVGSVHAVGATDMAGWRLPEWAMFGPVPIAAVGAAAVFDFVYSLSCSKLSLVLGL